MSDKYKNANVTLVVLGDIGRSPRMQYHALSFMKHNFNVDIIGYAGSKPLKQLEDDRKTGIIYLKSVPDLNVSRLMFYIFKTFWQTITLFMALVFKRRSNFVMLQNPPAIPTMFVCCFYCLLFRSKLIIDWHNYANSIMALNLGADNKLVKIAKWMESYFGKKADANFCVTRAMQTDLLKQWEIKAHVLYDRPPEIFKPITLKEKNDLFVRLSEKYPNFASGSDETVFTKRTSNGDVVLKENRPGIIVSSTSWTEDEDFTVLLNALAEYEESVEILNLPKLKCIITGKGPMKEYYLKRISEMNWQHVDIITPWLEIADYPLVLASADLGISLHTSSSGLDLPMKVVDMFGCNLPVCAYDFKCLHELVKDGENSFTFKDSKQLADQILKWFKNFPFNDTQKRLNEKFRMELTKFSSFRWQDNWDINVLTVINNLN